MLQKGVFVWAIGIALLFCVGAVGGISAQEQQSFDGIEQTDVGTVEVVVTDRAGSGIGGAEVTASWEEGEQTSTTASNGRAFLDVPRDETIEFEVSHPDYVRNHQPVERSDIVGEELTIEMAEPGEVAFTVVDTDGEPVDDVRIRLYHEQDNRIVDVVYTDADGTATIEGIEQRSYDVDTRRAGYLTAVASFDLDDETTSEQLEIESDRVTVDFTVRDDHFSPPEPIEGATIDIAEFGQLPPTFADGTQDQSLPVNDEYDITVTREGYLDATATLSVGEEPTALELETQRVPEVTIEPLQNVVVVNQQTLVTVTNAYGEPVQGAAVQVNSNPVGTTDDQGQIIFEITEPGENVVEANDGGLEGSVILEGVLEDDTVDDDSETDDGDQSETDDSDDGTDEGATDTDDAGADDGTEDDDTASDDSDGPGFGVGAAILALLLTVAAAHRGSE